MTHTYHNLSLSILMAELLDQVAKDSGLDKQFPFERTTAKPETLGMREENGYVGKLFKVTTEPGPGGVGVVVKATGMEDTTTADLAKKSIEALAPKLNPRPTPADFGVPRGYETAAVAFAECVNSQENAKLLNIIKSLTEQNEKKQAIINQQRKMFDRRTDLHRQLNKLIDTCAAANLI